MLPPGLVIAVGVATGVVTTGEEEARALGDRVETTDETGTMVDDVGTGVDEGVEGVDDEVDKGAEGAEPELPPEPEPEQLNRTGPGTVYSVATDRYVNISR